MRLRLAQPKRCNSTSVQSFLLTVYSRSDSSSQLKLWPNVSNFANVALVQRHEDSSHLAEVAHRLQQAMADLATRHLVLTGNGRSLQAIRAVLRTRETIPIEYLVKAYWTPEKILN